MQLSDLMPGLYVTVHGGGFAGWLIRTGTRAPVAHVYVYVGPQPSGHDIVEAEPGGVRLGHSSEYDWITSYPALDLVTAEQSEIMVATALTAVGKPYGWVADFYLGMREGLRLPTPGWLFKTDSVVEHRQCAQLADMVGIAAGVQYFDDGRSPGAVSPADLWRRDYR